MKIIKKRYRLKAEVKEALEDMFIEFLGVIAMVVITYLILLLGA